MAINLPLFFILAAGTMQSLFMGGCLFNISRKKVSDVLLAALLVVAGLRLLKSTLFIYEQDLPLWVINAGFGAHAAAAVLTLLYVKSIRPNAQWNRLWLLHLLPPLLLLVLAAQLTLDAFWYKGGYQALLYYSLFYLGWAFKEWAAYRKIVTRPLWLSLLLCSVALFLLSYFGNYVLRLYDYSYAPLPFALAVFPLSFLLWKSQYAKPQRNLRPEKLSPAEKERLHVAFTSLMDSKTPYLDPNLTLPALSKELKVTPHLLSYFMSQHLKSSFSKTVNAYRIEAACRMLSEPRLRNEKIASIAFGCGFNSLSVFNRVFQEMKGTTPAVYRKQSVHRNARLS